MMPTGTEADYLNTLAASPHNTGLPVIRSSTTDGISITCYDNWIPSFVESALEQRYASLYSSLAVMRAYDRLEGTSVFVASRDNKIFMIWLFQRRGKSVHVLNEAIAVNEAEARCFASHIFATYPDVWIISFNAVHTDIQRLSWPFRRQNCTEDSVLTLPATSMEYTSMLGKATRKNLKRYMARLTEQFPSFQYRILAKEEIDAKQIAEIVHLNRLRMNRKGKLPGITQDDEQTMFSIAQRHGMLLVATINGKICCGAIVFQFRDHYFSFVRAHDPAYDQYRLGLIGAYLLASECIARKGKELHFMWGREPHKALLMGVERKLDRLTLYRSAPHLFLSLHVVLKNAFFGYRRRFKLWLLEKMAQENNSVTKTANHIRRLFRQIKGLLYRPA